MGHAFRLILIAIWFALVSHPAAAQDNRAGAIDDAREALETISEEIDTAGGAEIDALEEQLRDVRDRSRERLADVEREISELESRLEPLGPAPAEGEPPESEAVAQERAALNEELSRLNGERTRINANIITANDLLAMASTSRIQRLYSELATRGPSPLSPSTWVNAAAPAASAAESVAGHFRKWLDAKADEGRARSAIGFSVGALVVAIIIFWPVNRWVMQTFATAFTGDDPPLSRRVMVAGLKMVARAVPGVIGGFLIIETWRAQGLITENGEGIARIFWLIILDLLIVTGFLRGLFAPENPAWRLAPIDASRGRVVSALIISIVFVFAAKTLLDEIVAITGAGPNLIALIDASAATTIAALLLTLARRQLWGGAALTTGAPVSGEAAGGEAKPLPSGWRYLRRGARALAIGMAAAALSGYTALADFIASRIYFLAAILALAWFFRAVMREGVFWLRDRFRDEPADTHVREDGVAENFEFWTIWLINFLLALTLAPIALILIGLPPSAVFDLAGQALFGFRIGPVQIPSLINVFLGLGVFVLVYAITRIIQRTVKAGPLSHSNMDPGAQDSLVTLIGYAGLIAAAFAAISAVGFDLGNLALIAGALSVGIGFGLQSIVNNFVSGLILLFERPIKAGDWIVTTSGEGIVKKISVRSTEIETFDRSSIIIPNSELVSSTVTNWTHKTKLGRVVVTVGVAYGSDVEKVKEILLRCANEHPLVVRFPEPFVTWQDFGASSLDFDVRAFLADISKGLSVRTDLRFAINKAFAEEGIEIPFPQRDVHVKSWPVERPEPAK
ncbi:MAG: DUF3772 domain-containing protein [Pseudomonadota bacterium]